MDIQDVVDRLCLGYEKFPSRAIEGAINEPLYAEIGALGPFRTDFLRRYPGGLVLSQLDYQSVSTPGDANTQLILDALDTYFRNWWSRKNPSREGGFRKPDGMGIARGGSMIELMEVKPYDNYSDGLRQLNEMIGIVKDGLRGYYVERCTRDQATLAFDPSTATVVRGTPWKPGPENLVVPLIPPPVNALAPGSKGAQAAAQAANEISWICYKPNLRKLPDGSDPAAGVVLYEIHRINKPQAKSRNQLLKLIPEDLARRLASAHANRVQTRQKLVPWAEDYVSHNILDSKFFKQNAKVLGYAALITLVAVAVIEFAPPLLASLGELAGGEMAAGGGDAAAETIVDVMEGGSYRTAPTVTRMTLAEAQRRGLQNVAMRVASEVEQVESVDAWGEASMRMAR
jgi:hypothetical protein